VTYICTVSGQSKHQAAGKQEHARAHEVTPVWGLVSEPDPSTAKGLVPRLCGAHSGSPQYNLWF